MTFFFALQQLFKPHIVAAEIIQGRKLFKGGNYLREETINLFEFFTAETIQRRKLFKGGNYSWKYGIL